ncbi:hypothetical protein BGZ73_007225 [Actinomortierella ambigua]|nr:hypothetical protein BGZ73_007225 [Actinomortierella ambigua]
MGIIDEEYLEEMSAVRSSYQRAFRQLVLSALTSIKQEQLILESRRIMAPPSTPTSDGSHATDISRINARLTEPMTAHRSPSHLRQHLHSPSMASSLFNDVALDPSELPTTTPLMRTLSFGDMFDNDPTRYKHDFVEIKRLGRGGFASVYKARNKLDGIEYAIKKVRLRGGAKMRYEKIFREIKFLARLDHKNVVRYYSSWLEHADYPVSSTGRVIDGEDEDDDEDDEYEDGTYATGDGDPSTQPNRPFHRPTIQGRRRSNFSSATADQDLSLGVSFEEDSVACDDEDGAIGIGMEKTVSNSTVTGRDIPRRPPLATLSPGRRHQHHHKSPSVSLEMEGRVPSWGRSDAGDTSDQDEEERDEECAKSYNDSASIGRLGTSSRTSSSIEEIQRSLPSSLNDSSLGSRIGRLHQHHHQHDLDSIDEIDTRAMASYPPRPDVHLTNDSLGMRPFDHNWVSNRMVQPVQHAQRQLPSRHHQSQHHRQQPMFTRDLTLFIQMQLCQTTLQDYLRYRNDQRGEGIQRNGIASLAPAPSITAPKHAHGKHRNDRFGALSSLMVDTGAPSAHAHSVPGSPSGSANHHNNDLVDPAVNQAIFRAIVEGVAYIHDQDMIHRDLKPGNIFLSVPPGMDLEQLLRESIGYHDHNNGNQGNAAEDESQQLAMWDTSSNSSSRNHGHHGYFGESSSPSLTETLPIEKVHEVLFQNVELLTPIIGDFGLVTDMDGSLTSSSTTPAGQAISPVTTASSRARTTAIGTVTYASPEQLARPNMGYDQKADIYSLGIIFFELYYPFSTLMERHAVLRTLRNGELPAEFVSRWPKEAAFVLWLMADDPALRPTAREILEFDLIRKTPSPSVPKAMMDPMDKAGQALLAGCSQEESTASRLVCKAAQTKTSPRGEDSQQKDEVAMGPIHGLAMYTEETFEKASSPPATMLLTAVEAMQVASSLPPTAPALYFSRQPICERCQTRCHCDDVQAGHGQAQNIVTPVAKTKVEEAGVPRGEREAVTPEQHHQQQEHLPIDQENHGDRHHQPHQQQQQQQRDSSQKPELRRRSSKRKSTGHPQRKPSQDASHIQMTGTTPPAGTTSAGIGGGVSLEAKLKRMEQSLAAMRLENKALLDRIQQLEYEKALAWNPALMDNQDGV